MPDDVSHIGNGIDINASIIHKGCVITTANIAMNGCLIIGGGKKC